MAVSPTPTDYWVEHTPGVKTYYTPPTSSPTSTSTPAPATAPTTAPAPTSGFTLTPSAAQNQAALGGSAPVPVSATAPAPTPTPPVQAFPGGVPPTTGQYATVPTPTPTPAPTPTVPVSPTVSPPAGGTTNYSNNSQAQGTDFYKVMGPNGQVDVFQSNGQKVPDIGTFHQLGLNIDWIPFRQQQSSVSGTSGAGVSATGSKYVRLAGSNAVFDISSGTPKYITAADAAKIPNFFSLVTDAQTVKGIGKDQISIIDKLVAPSGTVDMGKVNEVISHADLSRADLSKLVGLGTEGEASDAIGSAVAGAIIDSNSRPVDPQGPGTSYLDNTREMIDSVAGWAYDFDAQKTLTDMQDAVGLTEKYADIAKLKAQKADVQALFDQMAVDMQDDPDFIAKLKQRRLQFIDDKSRIALKMYDDKIGAAEDQISRDEKLVTDRYNAAVKNYELKSGLKKDQINTLITLNAQLDKANDDDRSWFATIVQNVGGTAWDDLTPEEQKKFVSGFSDPEGWETVLKAAMNASYKSAAANLALQKLALKGSTAGTNLDTRTVTATDANGLGRNIIEYFDKNTLQVVAREDRGATADATGAQGTALAITWLNQYTGKLTEDQINNELRNAGIVNNETITAVINSTSAKKNSGNVPSLKSYLDNTYSPKGVLYNSSGKPLGQQTTGAQVLDRAIMEYSTRYNTRELLRDALAPALNAYMQSQNVGATYTPGQIYDRILQIIPNRN